MYTPEFASTIPVESGKLEIEYTIWSHIEANFRETFDWTTSDNDSAGRRFSSRTEAMLDLIAAKGEK